MKIAIALVKFAALTFWIGVVAMWAENLFRASVWEELRMVEKCQVEANKKYQDDLSGWSDHYFRDGGYKEVLLIPRDRNKLIRECMFKHDQTFMTIF